MGPKVGKIHVPAVARQDDVTLIPRGLDEEPVMIETFEKSTDKNRVKLAIGKKTKVLVVGKIEDAEPTVMKKKVVKETENAKILGYVFNNKGNAHTHLGELY